MVLKVRQGVWGEVISSVSPVTVAGRRKESLGNAIPSSAEREAANVSMIKGVK